jgi:hypothetical protein
MRQVSTYVFFRSVAVANLLSLLAALALCAALIDRASGAPAGVAALCPTPSGRSVVRTVPLPGSPKQVLTANDALWVTLRSPHPGGRARLLRLDARTGRIRRAFPLPGSPDRIASGFGSLWIPVELRGKAGGTLLRLDPRSGRVLAAIRAPTPRLLGATLTMTPEAVWIGGSDTRLDARSIFKIDPRRNVVVRRFQVRATTVVALVGQRRSLWVSGWESVVRLSENGRLLFRQPVGGVAFSIALAGNGVWAAQQLFGHKDSRPQPPARRLVRITPGSPRLKVIQLDATPGAVAVAAGAAWAVFLPDEGRHEVLRVSGTTPVPARVAVSGIPGALAASRGKVWVAEHEPNELSEIC